MDYPKVIVSNQTKEPISIQGVKLVLAGNRVAAISINSHSLTRFNKTESAFSLFCRFSLFRKDLFFQIIYL